MPIVSVMREGKVVELEQWAEPVQPTIDLSAVDQDTLNVALTAEGSVVRALALVLLQEINTLRSKVIPPLPAYTQAQLVSALKAKMR